MKTLLLFLFLSPIFVYSQTEATIVLKGNKEYKVTILERGDKEIKVRTDKGAEVTILRENILSIEEGCKFSVNKIDDMTGESVRITKEELISNTFGKGTLSVRATTTEGRPVLSLNLSLHDIFSISQGNKILLKTTDDEIHEFTNPTYTMASQQIAGLGPWDANIFLFLKDYHLQPFIDLGVTKIRIYIDQGYKEFDIKEKNQMKIARVLNCIQ